MQNDVFDISVSFGSMCCLNSLIHKIPNKMSYILNQLCYNEFVAIKTLSKQLNIHLSNFMGYTIIQPLYQR